MKHILIVLIISFFILATTNKILEFDVNSCDLNQKQWALIKWYFERCTFIEITEIALNRSDKSQYSNQIIRGMIMGKCCA